MLVSEIKLNETSSQQMLECTVCETQISPYILTVIPVLCGICVGFFLSTVFWGSVIGVLIQNSTPN